MTASAQTPASGPPAAERVARRALCLAAVACRGSLERDAAHPQAEQFRQQIWVWAHSLGLEAELEADEAGVLQTELGRLQQRHQNDAAWSAEAVATLAWALGTIERPRYDTPCAPADVARSLGFMRGWPQNVLTQPTLKPPLELYNFQQTHFALHWRLRNYTRSATSLDFRDLLAKHWPDVIEAESMALIDNDVAIGSRPLTALDAQQAQTLARMAAERQRAANWLLGYHPTYAEVQAETFIRFRMCPTTALAK